MFISYGQKDTKVMAYFLKILKCHFFLGKVWPEVAFNPIHPSTKAFRWFKT